jgi:hypothetical protein
MGHVIYKAVGPSAINDSIQRDAHCYTKQRKDSSWKRRSPLDQPRLKIMGSPRGQLVGMPFPLPIIYPSTCRNAGWKAGCFI